MTVGRGNQKSKRKSGFAEHEEGYMYVESGFRIRFGNGEAIDFYADSADDKTKWLQVLDAVIGKVPESKPWASLALERELALKPRDSAKCSK